MASSSPKASSPTASLTAADIKAALRRRHPAFDPGLAGVGRWVCIEEWCNIDLLALDAWRSGDVIGYEVKVSRSDMRSELLDPTKRAAGVAMTTRFYFAVPAGLLTPEERAYEEPEWGAAGFKRTPCTNPDCRAGYKRQGWYTKSPKPRGPRLKGTEREGATIFLRHDVWACCTVCRGYGYTAKSKVESLAPYLWVPGDVGLVAVGPRGCSVLREAPRRRVTEPIIPWPHLGYRREDGRTPRRAISDADYSRLERQQLNIFARWVSARPDPRHAERRGDPIAPELEAEPEDPEQTNVWLG